MSFVNQEMIKKAFSKDKAYKERRELIEEGYEKFKIDNNSFKYDFINEARYCGADSEASYLSKIISIKMIELFLNENKKNVSIDDKTYNFKSKEGQGTVSSKDIYYNEGKNVTIGFDVMNNPNEPTNAKSVKNAHILWKNYKGNHEFLELKKIYHRIGNFTFFPRNIEKSDEFQKNIHNNKFKEDWNKSLSYLKENWCKYQFDGFCTFEEYIKMSLQQFYTKKRWNDLKNIIRSDQNRYQKLTSDNKLYEKELIDFYNEIKDSDNEIYHVKYDNDDIKVINAIVIIRSKLIIMLLKGKIMP